jgi:hypothetical protein
VEGAQPFLEAPVVGIDVVDVEIGCLQVGLAGRRQDVGWDASPPGGELQGHHEGYKCSIRKTWYVVPGIWKPDAFVFRQIYDFPRFVSNKANATSSDTIHRLRMRAGCTDDLVRNTYTWLTAASAEIEGRSYGGGVLELEPTEAEHLLVPNHISANAVTLDECDRLIRAGRIDDVLVEHAKAILKDSMGMSNADCVLLQSIWMKLRQRRSGRSKATSTKSEVS